MKKNVSLMLLFVMLVSILLSSCGTDKNGNNHKEIGLSFYLPEDFEKVSFQNYAHSYTNGEAEFLINASSYEQLSSTEGTDGKPKEPWPTDLYTYVRRFAIENDISLSNYTFDHDNDRGDIRYVYDYNDEEFDMESEYCHYVFLDNGEAIFFITYSCRVSYTDKYKPLFEDWSSRLVLDKVK